MSEFEGMVNAEFPGSIPPGADDIVQTIRLALARGYTAAEILDENSPIRDRILAYAIPAKKQAEEPIAYRVWNGGWVYFDEQPHWNLSPVFPLYGSAKEE